MAPPTAFADRSQTMLARGLADRSPATLAGRQPRRPRASLAAVLALALAATLGTAACGDAGRAVGEPTGRFSVRLDDFLIRPQQIHAPTGRLTITIVDRGRIGHALALRAPSGRMALRFLAIKPGRRETRSVRLPPGRYTMFCPIAGHAVLGMHGTLVVR